MAPVVKSLAPVDPGYAVMPALTRLIGWSAVALFAWGGASWAMARPEFALTELEVATPVKHVTEAQLRLIVDRRVRGTFFTVDLERVRESLEKLPWVAEARVERRWPGTLVVSLTEHTPVARWGDNALVSDAGLVFSAAVDDTLPRLAGPAGSAPEVLAHWHSFGKTLKPLGLDIATLTLSPRRAWTMTLTDGTRLTLGRKGADTRLARFVAFYPTLFADAAPQTVDLRYPDGFAVRPAAGTALTFPPRPDAADTPTHPARPAAGPSAPSTT